MAYQQQKCVPHGSRSCVQSKFKAVTGSLLDGSPLPGSQTDGSLYLQVGEVREFSGVLFVRALSPLMRTRYRITTQVPSHWWAGFNVWIAGWVGPHALWVDLLSISLHNFTTSYIDYSENTSSLSCGLLPNVDPFHYTISNSTCINISTNIIWEVFKYCDTIKLMMLDTRFLKI